MFIDLSLPIVIDESEWQTDSREESLMRLGHKGTHLDRVLQTTVPLSYFKSRAIKIDVSTFSQQRAIEPADLPFDQIQPGDFVLIHSGAIQRHGYGSRAYFEEFFELSWAVVDQLIERQIHFIGIDARGIRQNTEHREADARCEQAGIYIIENMNQTDKLPALTPFTVYTTCFDLNSTGVPCRVIAEVDRRG